MIIIPVYNQILVPGISLYYKADQLKELAGKEPEVNEKVIFLVTKDEKSRDELDNNSFEPIGAQGTISAYTDGGYAVVAVDNRISVESADVHKDGTILVTYAVRPDIIDMTQEEQDQRFERAKRQLREFIQTQQWGQMALGYVDQWKSLAQILVSLSGWLMIPAADKYKLLATDSIAERTKRMEQILYEFIEMLKLNGEAAAERSEDYQKLYREDAIKKQIQFLQGQLDQMHPEEMTDLRKLEKRIQNSGMNDEAMKEVTGILNRLKQEGSQSQEYGMLYDYLDFMASLDWKKAPAEKIDLKKAEEILDQDHYGLTKVKKRIIQQIAVMDLNKKQSGSILLFVGAPGTGKTSIGQSIAKALGRKYVRVSLGGVRDEAEIRGHRRTYVGAMPGRIMDAIKKSGVSNPVMVLDEVDKLGVSYNGDPSAALLEVLDPEQNSTFTDHYMNVPYDLSNVVFICTANSTDTIPEPLLNRMEVISFTGYTPDEKFEIAKRHLLPKAESASGIDPEKLVVDDAAIHSIIEDYTREGGVRGLKKCMDALCRVAAVEIVSNPDSQVHVTVDSLPKYLDAKPMLHEHALAEKRPGVVTGLAWTQVGGEILFIETLASKGKGKLTMTGQLGDVMKESAEIAISLVKSMFPEKADFFAKNDIHIHVPEGAVKKDGPSAGITLTTALSSLVTKRAVSPEYAMTGEVSLRGVVMPIGGLPEKLMAAQRAGIKKVFIPADNVRDLDDVADEVKQQLTIIPVHNVTDVLKETGIMDA